MLYGAIYGFRTLQIVVGGNNKNFNFYYFYNVFIIEIITMCFFVLISSLWWGLGGRQGERILLAWFDSKSKTSSMLHNASFYYIKNTM